MRKKDEEQAVFWCSLLEPILFGEVEAESERDFLRKLSQKEKLFPNGARKKPSLSTLRRKLRKYRNGGFQALDRKPRADRGKPRAHGQEVIDRAIEIKKDQPKRSDEVINRILETERNKRIPKSTLYRHLKKAGATRVKLGVLKKKVRRRFTRERSNELWIGDFAHGPYVLLDNVPVSTRLSAFIDCHSRFIVEARYYYYENLDVLIDSYLRALVTYGAPDELYLDNAKVYRSKALRSACYAMHTRLIHRTPRDPAPGGLIERFFQTVQGQFEAEVRAGSILTLEELNRSFAAWLDVSYHDREHTETKQAPRARYQHDITSIRRVDMAAILPFFMKRDQRRVDSTFSDVQLNGRFYQVDAKLRGDKLEVRSDPYSDGKTVLLYSLDEQYLGEGHLHERKTSPQVPDEVTAKSKIDVLGKLRSEHERRLQKNHEGIDFRKALASRQSLFLDFAKLCAHLLGRAGDLSAWTTDELAELKRSYDQVPALTDNLVRKAAAMATQKNLSAVLFEIRRLAQAKEL